MMKLFSLLLVASLALLVPSCNSQLVTNSDPIAASSHANCIAYPDNNGLYNVQACPIYSGTQTVYPYTLTGETLLTFASRDDGFNTTNIGFSVTLYGNSYSRVAVGTNGVLMFGSSPSGSIYNKPIPDTGYTGNVGPVIEPLQGDMYLLTAAANGVETTVTTGFVGASPNRLFVIRYSRVTAYNFRLQSPIALSSFDVVFFQNSTSFQIRYYRLDVPATLPATPPALSVGIQAADTTRYAAVFSSSTNYAGINAALLGNVLSFTALAAGNSTTGSSTGAAGPAGPTIPASSHANCLSFPDTQNFYTVQACPIYSGVQTVYAPTLTGETVLTFDSTDDAYTSATIPFPVTIYGNVSSTVAVSTNGLLMFGSTPSSSYAVPIPDPSYNSGAGPVIHPLQGDMYLLDAISSISTGVSGSSPNRIFVVRYNRFTSYAARLATPAPLFSFDVFLYQNSSAFSINYYRIDIPTISNSVSVGVQGASSSRYVAVYSQSSNYTAISAALLGNSLSFTPTGSVVVPGSSSTGAARSSSSSAGAASSSASPASSSAAPVSSSAGVAASTGASIPVIPTGPTILVPGSSHANCLSFPDPQNQYTVQACPIYSGAQTVYAPALTSETVLAFSDTDDAFTSTAIPFPVTIYGNVSSTVAVSTNGLLMFGSTPVSVYAVGIPDAGYNGGAGPVIHPLQGDMYLLSAFSNISTGIIGSSPNRIFVVRYNRITTYTAHEATPAPLFSFDVFLYQNSSAFSISYYRIDSPAASLSSTVSIGVQGSSASRYVAVYSQSSDFAAISTALLGNTLSFTPTGSVVVPGTSSTGAARSSSAAPASSSAGASSSSAAASLRSSSSSSAAGVIITPSSSSAAAAPFVTSSSDSAGGAVSVDSSSSSAGDSNPPPQSVNGSNQFKPSTVLTVLASVIFFVLALN